MIAFLTLKGLQWWGLPGVILTVVGYAVTFGLWLSYKSFDFWVGTPVSSGIPKHVLTVVGFSFVALRLTDAGIAVAGGKVRAPGLIATVNYLIPFHMLAAGPIQPYEDFALQAPGPATKLSGVAGRSYRIAHGLFKKFVVCSVLGVLLTNFRSYGHAYFLLELQVNAVWLYLDFSAYSDIAVGGGR